MEGVVLEEYAGVETGEVGLSAKENITFWSLLQLRIYTSTVVFSVCFPHASVDGLSDLRR